MATKSHAGIIVSNSFRTDSKLSLVTSIMAAQVTSSGAVFEVDKSVICVISTSKLTSVRMNSGGVSLVCTPCRSSRSVDRSPICRKKLFFVFCFYLEKNRIAPSSICMKIMSKLRTGNKVVLACFAVGLACSAKIFLAFRSSESIESDSELLSSSDYRQTFLRAG